MRIILPLLVCLNLSAVSLEQNEADYQAYIAQNDPYQRIQSIKNLEKIQKRHYDLYMERREQVYRLMVDLDVVCKRFDINLGSLPFYGKKDSTILKMFSPIVFYMSFGGFGGDPKDVAMLQQIELGRNAKDLGLSLSSGVEKEMDMIFHCIRPILVEYTVKSYLADQEVVTLLNSEKEKKLYQVWEQIWVENSLNLGDESDLVTALQKMASLKSGAEIEMMIMEKIGEYFAYFFELAEGAREPENALEEACLPVFMKHKRSLSDEWSKEIKRVRYCYLR